MLSLARDGRAAVHLTLYPCRLLGHASTRIVSFSDMQSKPTSSAAWLECDSLQPLSSCMLSVSMAVPGGSGFRRRSGRGGAVCRQSSKQEGKRRKNPVLDTVGSIATLFWITPLSSNGRGQARAAVSGAAGHWMWWRYPLDFIRPWVHL